MTTAAHNTAAAATNTALANAMLKQFRAARNAGAPLIAIQTPDPQACMAGINVLMKDKNPPMVSWDTIRGFLSVGKSGEMARVACQSGSDMPVVDFAQACINSEKLPDGGILFMMNAQRFLTAAKDDTANIQAVWNLRDQFKSNGRTLVLLAPNVMLPVELANDTLLLDEALPVADQLRNIALECYKNAEVTLPPEATMLRIVDAVSGLSAFPAEQAIAMSMRKNGIDMDALWERKRQMVEQTRGLTVYRGKEKFADVAGLGNIKTFLGAIIKGEEPPRVVVFIDEIEKAIGGAGGGDMSHVSTDQVGTMLSFMEDNSASGIILIGPAGTGKSMMAKATGNEATCPTVALDLGGMKGSFVGESEGNIRNALKVCKAIGGDRLFFIATCNSITALSPELRRRYTDGIFFMDLPDATERDAAWKLYCDRYKITGARAKRPADEGWTGAEIRNCCRQAWKLRMTLEEASMYVVPVARSSGAQIKALQQACSGKFISASAPGLYQMPATEMPEASAPAPASLPTGGRRIVTE